MPRELRVTQLSPEQRATLQAELVAAEVDAQVAAWRQDAQVTMDISEPPAADPRDAVQVSEQVTSWLQDVAAAIDPLPVITANNVELMQSMADMTASSLLNRNTLHDVMRWGSDTISRETLRELAENPYGPAPDPPPDAPTPPGPRYFTPAADRVRGLAVQNIWRDEMTAAPALTPTTHLEGVANRNGDVFPSGSLATNHASDAWSYSSFTARNNFGFGYRNTGQELDELKAQLQQLTDLLARHGIAHPAAGEPLPEPRLPAPARVRRVELCLEDM